MPSEYEIKRAYEKGAQGGQRVPKSTWFGLVKTSREELAANRRGLNDGYRSEERERRQRERDEERQQYRGAQPEPESRGRVEVAVKSTPRSVFTKKPTLLPFHLPYFERGRKAALEGGAPQMLSYEEYKSLGVPQDAQAAIHAGYSEGALEVLRREGLGRDGLINQLTQGFSWSHLAEGNFAKQRETVAEVFDSLMQRALFETYWTGPGYCDDYRQVAIAGYAYGCAKRLDPSLP